MRVDSPHVTGGALAVDDALVHLAAFAVQGRGPAGTRIARPRRGRMAGDADEEAR